MSWRRRPADEGGLSQTVPRKRWLAALGAVAIVVVVGLLVWSANSDESSRPAAGEPGSSTSRSTTSPSESPVQGEKTPSGSTASATASPSDRPTGAAVKHKPRKVQFNQTAEAAKGVGLEIVKIESVKANAQIPGEVSGPALRFTVQVSNETDRRVAIDSAVSNFYYGKDKTPATPMLKPGSKAFPRSVRAGGTATGVLLYTVPQQERDVLLLEIILDNEMRTIEFSGACPEDC